MFKEYLDFRIHIDRLTESGYLVSVRAPGGDGRSVLVPPTSNPAYQQLAEKFTSFDADEEVLNHIGQLLFQALFTGEIKDVYFRSQGVLREGQGLRLTIEIAASEREMAVVPWELLTDPEHGPMVMLDMPVVRYLPQQLPPPVLALPQRMRVLLTGAQPHAIGADIAHELEVVEAALRALGAHVRIVVEPHLTKAILQRRLREQFHVWHFVGSNGFSQDGETGWLAFEDTAGDTDIIKANELQILLQRSGVQLAVLSAGESAKLTVNPLRSVAPALIRAQVPAVVAMQFAVPAPITHAFAVEFYRTLVEGFPIDACVTEGRKAIMNEVGLERPYWSVPVIYTRAPTGQLFVPRSDMPPDPTPLPEGVGLVGRTADLEYYTQKLASRHMAVITGMPGVGKTTLGAALARHVDRPDKTFWHSFQESGDIDRCVRKLIEFLAWDGQDELWRRLRSIGQTKDRLPTTDELLDHMLPLLRGRDYLLCLDDFQFVENAGDSILHLTRQLCEAALAGQLSLIITAWRMPPVIVQYEEFKPLEGLAPDAIGDLLSGERYNLSLAPDQVASLHDITGGNTQFVTLAANALRDGADPASLIDELAQTSGNTQQMAVVLSNRVDRLLSPDQRAVMRALAVLNGSGSADAIEATLDASDSLRLPLLDLRSCGLLSVTRQRGKEAYGQHAFLRTFYYATLIERDRLAMHRRAGDYFAPERRNRLRAAQHFLLGEEFARAVSLATADMWQILSQGQARELLAFLRTFAPDQLDDEQWAAVCTALGEVHALLGEFEPARTHLEQALEAGAARAYGAVPTDDQDQINAQAQRYQLLARVDERTGALDQAEANCRAGLGLIEHLPLPNVQAARLHAQLADVWLRRGDPDEAQRECRQGLDALPPEPAAARERVRLSQRMATLDIQHGRHAQAILALEQSLVAARRIGDPALIALVLNNLSLSLQRTGQLDRALEYYQESLRIKEQIGDIPDQVNILINLGNLYTEHGDYDRALPYYERSRNLSVDLKMPETLASVMVNIGITHYQQYLFDKAQETDHLNQALENFQQAHVIFSSLDDMLNITDCLYRLGDVELAQGDASAALTYGGQALELAEQFGGDAYKSCALRVIGEALLAQNHVGAAVDTLDRAWQTQQQVHDPFDQPLIRAALARLWLADGDRKLAAIQAQDGLALARQHGSPYLIGLLEQLLAEIEGEA